MFLSLLCLCSTVNLATSFFSSISTSMFANSVDSDFLYLNYNPTSSVKNANHPGGVYALETFDIHHFICQPRGFLVPIENASHFSLSGILTYNLYTPGHSEMLNLDDESVDRSQEQHYILVDNTICSRIRFCFPVKSGEVGSCGNAMLARYDATGMLLVKPLKVIPAGTEIIVELHSYYNYDAKLFNERCHFDPHGCGISSSGEATPKQLGVIPSEFFSLYLAPSSIPGVGLGVFNKFDIPPHHIITPCQGKVYHFLYHQDAEKHDRMTAPQKTATNTVVIQMDNFCGFTNDIIDISFLKNNSYTEEDMQRVGSIPKLPGFEYNAMQGGAEYRLSSIISITHIPAHTEIMQQYGETYWWHRYKEIQSNRQELVQQELEESEL